MTTSATACSLKIKTKSSKLAESHKTDYLRFLVHQSSELIVLIQATNANFFLTGLAKSIKMQTVYENIIFSYNTEEIINTHLHMGVSPRNYLCVTNNT